MWPIEKTRPILSCDVTCAGNSTTMRNFNYRRIWVPAVGYINATDAGKNGENQRNHKKQLTYTHMKNKSQKMAEIPNFLNTFFKKLILPLVIFLFFIIYNNNRYLDNIY